MPPRLPLLSLPSSALSTSHPPLLTALTSLALALSSHHSQSTTPSLLPNPSGLPSRPRQISTSILSSLTDVPSSYNRRIRRGRGPSSGKGKTSGRGHKGQKQHGHVPVGFQGGQTPLEVVHGKRGFENVHSVPFSPLNIGRLQSWVDQGRLPSGGDQWLTVKELVDSRCIHGVKAGGVKLLAGEGKEGVLRSAVNIVVARASEEAIRKVEAAGGKVVTRYHGKSVGAGVGGGVRRVVRGEADAIGGLGLETIAEEDAVKEAGEERATYTPLLESGGAIPTVQGQKEWKYKLPDPTSRKDIEYYRDERKRGYLSHLVPDGEGPSLFFKTPGTGAKRGAKGKGAGAKKLKERGENRIF